VPGPEVCRGGGFAWLDLLFDRLVDSVVRLVGWLVEGMSTAVAAGVSPAHGGFRRSGSGKPDPEEADRMRNANGFFSVPDEEEEEEEEEHEHGEAAAAARREEDEEEEEEGALSEASSIGAASSDSSSIGENSASDKEEDEDEEEVESKVQGLGMMGLATLESLEDALPTK